MSGNVTYHFVFSSGCSLLLSGENTECTEHWDLQNIDCFLITEEGYFTSSSPGVCQFSNQEFQEVMNYYLLKGPQTIVFCWCPRHLQNDIRVTRFCVTFLDMIPTQHFEVEDTWLCFVFEWGQLQGGSQGYRTLWRVAVCLLAASPPSGAGLAQGSTREMAMGIQDICKAWN